MELMEEEF